MMIPNDLLRFITNYYGLSYYDCQFEQESIQL